MTSGDSPQFESTATISNDGADELVLVVEPWASELSIPPGAVYSVEAKSRVPGTLEVERRDDRVICWAWPHSTVEVWHGEKLVESHRNAVPDVPEGMTVRRFLRGRS